MTIFKRETMQGLYEYEYSLSLEQKAKYEDGTYFYRDIELGFVNFWNGFELAMRVYEVNKKAAN